MQLFRIDTESIKKSFLDCQERKFYNNLCEMTSSERTKRLADIYDEEMNVRLNDGEHESNYKYIENIEKSILNQTNINFESLVKDDASVDRDI